MEKLREGREGITLVMEGKIETIDRGFIDGRR